MDDQNRRCSTNVIDRAGRLNDVRILALEIPVPGVADEAFGPLATEEAARLWALVQADVVRETWFRAERTDAVLVLECASVRDAEAALGTLPFVRAGLIRFELVGLRPYPGFARLFGEAAG